MMNSKNNNGPRSDQPVQQQISSVAPTADAAQTQAAPQPVAPAPAASPVPRGNEASSEARREAAPRPKPASAESQRPTATQQSVDRRPYPRSRDNGDRYADRPQRSGPSSHYQQQQRPAPLRNQVDPSAQGASDVIEDSTPKEAGPRSSVNVQELKEMNITSLIAYAQEHGVNDVASLKKQEIIFKILETPIRSTC